MAASSAALATGADVDNQGLKRRNVPDSGANGEVHPIDELDDKKSRPKPVSAP